MVYFEGKELLICTINFDILQLNFLIMPNPILETYCAV